MDRTGTVAIVFYTKIYGDVHVLLGQETQYLSDLQDVKYISFTNLNEIFEKLSIHALSELETTRDPCPEDVFRKNAEYLTTHLRFRNMSSVVILYEPIRSVQSDDGVLEHTTRFRIVKDESVTKFGIVKGGIEDNETERDCILREVYEEIDYRLNTSKLDFINTFIVERFQYDPLHVFSYYVPYYEMDRFLSNINRLKTLGRGEMCHFKFIPYKNVMKEKLNQKSAYCLKQCYKIIG
jgi:8-oxo-dGTP pyrophosphatase MutT (NUDIX family)